MRSKKTPTPWTYGGELYTNANGYYGFVYRVVCHHPMYKDKEYIGRKFFYVNFDKPRKIKDSDWRTYKTSSTVLKGLIQDLGVEHFTFEILQLFETRGGVVYAEVQAQVFANVLHQFIGPERKFFNGACGDIKFVAKETLSRELKEMLFNENR